MQRHLLSQNFIAVERGYMVTKKTTRTSTKKHSNSNHDVADTDILNLPLLPIRNTVLLPNLVTPLIVGRDQSIKAIEEALNKDRILFVVTQLNEELEDPGQDDVYIIGVEGMVDRVLKMPDGTTSVLLHGQRRLTRLEYTQQTPFIRVRAEIVDEEIERTLTVDALVRATMALFEKCVKLSNTLPEEAYLTALNMNQQRCLPDLIVSAIKPQVA